MTRRIRVRSLSDRQLHEHLARAFAAFSLCSTTRETVEACMELERLLDEESRRLRAGRAVCVCSFCLGARDLIGQDWPTWP